MADGRDPSLIFAFPHYQHQHNPYEYYDGNSTATAKLPLTVSTNFTISPVSVFRTVQDGGTVGYPSYGQWATMIGQPSQHHPSQLSPVFVQPPFLLDQPISGQSEPCAQTDGPDRTSTAPPKKYSKKTRRWSGEEERARAEMKEFITYFKQKRIGLGYRQADVGLALGALYGNMFSQTTICRFEAFQLSFKNMLKLKPVLQDWLQQASSSVGNLPNVNNTTEVGRNRRKRTSIDGRQRSILDQHFMNQPKPSAQETEAIADQLGLSRDVVRVWFCNRRQKLRRTQKKTKTEMDVGDGGPVDGCSSSIFPISDHSVPSTGSTPVGHHIARQYHHSPNTLFQSAF